MTAAAGWYPDPAGVGDRYRWWDGATWTRQLSTDPQAPAPVIGAEVDGTGSPAASTAAESRPPVAATPSEAPTAPDEASPDEISPDEVSPDELSPPDRATGRSYPPGYGWTGRPQPRRAAPVRRLPRWIPVAVVAVLLAGVIAILIDVGGDRQVLSAPPTDVPTAPAPIVDYDATNRLATAGGLEVVMPAEPYLTFEDPSSIGFLRDSVSSFAPLEEDYDGNGSDWGASVNLGFVADDYVGDDLPDTLDKLYRGYLSESYGGAQVRTTKREETAYDNYPRPTRILTADAHYSIDGVSSSYDDVSVLVVDNEDGTYSGLLVSRPDKRPDRVEQVTQETFETIKILG